MHGVIVRTEQLIHGNRVGGREIVGVYGRIIFEAACSQIENTAFFESIGIGIETDETCEFDHKHEMEVGKRASATV